MWVCPKCRKKFKRKHQPHSCAAKAAARHFEHVPVRVHKTFEILMNRVRRIGPVAINSTTTSIHIKSDVTFLGIKPMKDHLKIDFYLRKKTADVPIVNTLTMSKNRIVHTVLLDSPSDITKKLVGWIKESYDLVTVHPHR